MSANAPGPGGEDAAPMKLHWSPRSPFVRKVMVAAHELGLADRIERVRSLAAMAAPNPAIMADNPLSKIPALVLTNGEVLVDSAVIIEYLDALAGGNRLLPPAGPARWAALSRHAMANGLLDLLVLWRNERDKPEARRTPEWLDAFAVKAAATLDRFEREAPSLAGQGFGLFPITLATALSYLDFRFADLGWRENRPGLAAWHREAAARPSMQATEAVDA